MKISLLPAFVFLISLHALQAQCPVIITTCNSQSGFVCDQAVNDAYLWNDPVFYDAIHGLNDLAEAEVTLSISVRDSCHPANRRISFALLLDLDGDGVQETAVWSDSLPPIGRVRKGNAANPNYNGGSLVRFDQRPVPNNQLYQFALQQSTKGDTVIAGVKWKTSFIVTDPKLPLGKHKIMWFIESGSQKDTCIQTFVVKDCKQPTVVCLNGLSVNIQQSQTIELYASDFLQYTQDNCTPAYQLQLGIRKSGTGIGFPVDGNGHPISLVSFGCSDMGTQMVDLWSIDKAGNADHCTTYLIIQDNLMYCNQGGGNEEICAVDESNNLIKNVKYQLSSPTSPPYIPPVQIMSDTTGCAHLAGYVSSSNYVITPIKNDNPLNGVSTYDLVQISKHILGLKPLGSPYKMIAADANKNGSVTTFDVVEIRKLILGIYSSYPNNTSWRFVPKNYVFPNPYNPFSATFPETKTKADLALSPDFVGIKIGDVNNSVISNATGDAATERGPMSFLMMPDLHLKAGQILEIPVRVTNSSDWLGLQLHLHCNPDALIPLACLPGAIPDMTAGHYHVSPSGLSVSWSDARPHTFLPGQDLFKIRVKALRDVTLSDAIRLDPTVLRPEAYPEGPHEISDLALEFRSETPGLAGTTISRVVPNPTTADAEISIYLAEPELLRLVLTDETGRNVLRQSFPAEAGITLLRIPETTMPQKGVYYWQVVAGAISASGKLIRI